MESSSAKIGEYQRKRIDRRLIGARINVQERNRIRRTGGVCTVTVKTATGQGRVEDVEGFANGGAVGKGLEEKKARGRYGYGL